MASCFLSLSPFSPHAWIKLATRVPASLLFLGFFDLTQVRTSSGRVFRNCASTSCSIICSLVWVSGCSHCRQSSWIWLTTWWGPVTKRYWKSLNFWWETFRAPGFLMGMVSGFSSWSRRQKSWGFFKISKTSVTCSIFTAWPFTGWRYSKRQAAPEHTLWKMVGRVVSYEKKIQKPRTCRSYVERFTNGLHLSTGQWGGGDLKQKELLHFTQMPKYTFPEICTSPDKMLLQPYPQIWKMHRHRLEIFQKQHWKEKRLEPQTQRTELIWWTTEEFHFKK